MSKFLIGQGFDIHRLQSKEEYCQDCNQHRDLYIGGVVIEHAPYVALGHSDGDCLLHAIIDALLGAFALGDIGDMFSDQDNAYKDISSVFLLKEVLDKISSLNSQYQIVNIDSTIILESPKLADYKKMIANNIAKILNINNKQVNVKAKTNEKLDAIGDNRAISAQAVVLLEKI